MVYLIKDEIKEMFGYIHTSVVKVCLNEDEVMSWLSDPKNLKLFKGDIKVERVVL